MYSFRDNSFCTLLVHLLFTSIFFFWIYYKLLSLPLLYFDIFFLDLLQPVVFTLLQVDAALIATGRAPFTQGLGLENVCISSRNVFRIGNFPEGNECIYLHIVLTG